MASMWGLGGLSWKDLCVQVYKQVSEDDIFGRAAQLSYYFLLALIPLLLFLTSVIGIALGSGTGLRHSLFDYLGRVMPPSAFKLIDTTMYEVSAGGSGGKLSFGILAALWAASSGMTAIIGSLNVAYEVKETRPWWRTRLTAILLTIALSFIIIIALILVLYGGGIAEYLSNRFGLGDAFTITWKIAQYPLAIIFVLLAFSTLYYVAPNLKNASWKFVTPGAVIGVALWLLVSFGFRLYLNYFDSYNKTYGSLGAVIILMLWFYFTGLAILIGGGVNSEIEKAMAKAGDASAKAEKRSGQKRETSDGQSASAKVAQTDDASPRADASRAQTFRFDREERKLALTKVGVAIVAWVVSKLRRTVSTRH